MKTKSITILGLLFTMTISVMAQEYKVAKSTGKLVITDINHVTIEGHSGNEIIFSSLDGPSEKDKRAEGLRMINGMGLEDNTGFGLSVQDKGATVEVLQLKKMDGPRVKILVPKGVAISVSHNSPHGDDVKIKNIESEIEVSTLHNGVEIENATGPMTVKTIHGEIEVTLPPTAKSPISIVSAHGFIDVTMPVALKANVGLATSHGEIFVDPAIKIEFDQKTDMVRYGSSKVNGKVNGGGIELGLSSSHGNIYLRKK